MRKFIGLILLVGAPIIAGLWASSPQWVMAQGSGFGEGARIIFSIRNPGWQPPGSIWVDPSNASVYYQTNSYNTNLAVVYSNRYPVCTANCQTASALYTNYLVSWYTQNVANGSWIVMPNGTNGQPVPPTTF